MKNMDAIGVRLREAREARGETIAALSRRAGVEELWLWRIENGKTARIEREGLLKVANALGLEVLAPSEEETA